MERSERYREWLLGFAIARIILGLAAIPLVPPIADRVITPKRVKKFDKALDRKGPRLILLGRMAALSSAMIAVAAGATKMPAKEFLPPDAVGGAVSFALATGAGYLLGAAHDEAGPWLTALAALALVGFAFVLGRQLQKT